MQYRSQYAETRLLILQGIRPATGAEWIAAIIYCVSFFTILRWEITIQGVVSWTGIWLLIAAVFFLTPPDLVLKWFGMPPFLRAGVCAVSAYVVTVLLGHATDIKNLSAVWEILTLTGGAPVTAIHFVGVLGAFYFFRTQSFGAGKVPQLQDLYVSGPRLIPFERAKAEAAKLQSTAKPNLQFGPIEIPIFRGNENFLFVGGPGSGKSTCIQLLQQSLFPHIEKGSNKRALIYDAKRDIVPLLKAIRPSATWYLLNPFDQRGYAWDLAQDMVRFDNKDDHRIPIEIASLFFPVEPDSKSKYFIEASQAIMAGLMESFQFLTEGKVGFRWGLRDVVLALREDARMRCVLEAGGSTTVGIAERYLGQNETERAVLTTIDNKMKRLTFVAAAWDAARKQNQLLSLRAWLQEESILVLGSDPEAETIIKQLNEIMFSRLVQLVRSGAEVKASDSPRQTWFFIDELRHAGRLPGIEVLTTFGRSKAACTVLAFQDIDGLEHAFGPGNDKLAREAVNNCENKAFLRITSPRTRQFGAETFGEQEVDIPRPSESRTVSHGPGGTTVSSGISTSYQRLTRKVVSEGRFMSDLPRPDKAQGIGISGFYQTALVHEPFKGVISSRQIEEEIRKPDHSVPAFLQRPSEDDVLQEWTIEDLRRLNLEEYRDILLKKTGEGPAGEASNNFPDPEPPKNGPATASDELGEKAPSWRTIKRPRT